MTMCWGNQRRKGSSISFWAHTPPCSCCRTLAQWPRDRGHVGAYVICNPTDKNERFTFAINQLKIGNAQWISNYYKQDSVSLVYSQEQWLYQRHSMETNTYFIRSLHPQCSSLCDSSKFCALHAQYSASSSFSWIWTNHNFAKGQTVYWQSDTGSKDLSLRFRYHRRSHILNG